MLGSGEEDSYLKLWSGTLDQELGLKRRLEDSLSYSWGYHKKDLLQEKEEEEEEEGKENRNLGIKTITTTTPTNRGSLVERRREEEEKEGESARGFSFFNHDFSSLLSGSSRMNGDRRKEKEEEEEVLMMVPTKIRSPRDETDKLVREEHGVLETPLKDIDAQLNDLTDATKYDMVQRNGQRIYGIPPSKWTGEAPEKGSEIFVGKVPRDCFENELVPLFSSVGKIFELRLMMDFSGSNRGYLFVKYTTAAEAKRAIRELNNYEIRPGKRIGVCRSVDNRKLWISGLPKDRTREEIKSDLEKKTSGVTDVIIYSCQTDKSKTRSYAFVEYENHRAAALARRKLVPGRIFILDHEIEKVDWAQPEVEVDQEIMSKVQVLFVRNLSPITSESKIGQIFEGLSGGKLERVRKTKDFAFIHFQTREAAENALNQSQNLYVDGCLLDVSWSKPVDKDLYNTRKELTRMFSSGSMANGNCGFQSINGFNNNPFRGAPGTTPPRSLVLKMLNARHNLKSGKNYPFEGISNTPSSVGGSLCDTDSGIQSMEFVSPIFDVGTHNHFGRSMQKANAAQFIGCPGITSGNGVVHYTLGYPFHSLYGRFPAPPSYSSVMAMSSPHGNNYVDPLSLSMYQMSLN